MAYGFLLFATTIYSLRILRVSKIISLLTSVLSAARTEMICYGIWINAFFFGFTGLFYIRNTAYAFSYRDIPHSWLSILLLLHHHFCYNDYIQFQPPLLGSILVVSYSMFMTYIGLAFFIVILNYW